MPTKTMMLFYVYLISLIATIGVIQAQTLPSATTCAKGSPISIKRNDCKEAFGQFAIERGIIFWSPHASCMDKCTGAPANVTIGITQPISVLLDNGVGNQQC
ncbi:hypothetical protein MJO28_013738 [Puccinia striiformis f. sp. tritici]|uniref:Uncharacterized protein n=1 Tax=Puccinia striiformis f. sp. tritici TaxID=168172 RepID=A0ACC0DVF1_9BASI|nr:hypothetical protein MJO28_013738 [Puccinia striiformis f. sp. tritici]